MTRVIAPQLLSLHDFRALVHRCPNATFRRGELEGATAESFRSGEFTTRADDHDSGEGCIQIDERASEDGFFLGTSHDVRPMSSTRTPVRQVITEIGTKHGETLSLHLTERVNSPPRELHAPSRGNDEIRPRTAPRHPRIDGIASRGRGAAMRPAGECQPPARNSSARPPEPGRRSHRALWCRASIRRGGDHQNGSADLRNRHRSRRRHLRRSTNLP